jgi:regulator of replication initiation timing
MSDENDDGRDALVTAGFARRIEHLAYQAERQRQTISDIVKEAVALDMRVRSLETFAQTRAVAEAREDERDKALYERLTRMEDQIKETRGEIKEIKGIGSKALWIVGSALLTALVAFVIKGGLA